MIYSVGDISLLYLLNYIKLIAIVSSVIENKSENILMKCYATVQVPVVVVVVVLKASKQESKRRGEKERKRGKEEERREGGKKEKNSPKTLF